MNDRVKRTAGLSLILLLVTIMVLTMMPTLTWAASSGNINSASALRNALTSGKGGTYRLTGDVKGITKSIKISKGTYNLDLNGHTVKGKNKTYSLIFVTGGKLTITDSSTDDSGGVRNTYNQDAVGCIGGRLTINGGNYSGSEYAVFMAEKANVTINGGSFHGDYRCICVHKGTAKINGGNFSSLYNTIAMEGGSLTVTGGTFASAQSDALNINTSSNSSKVYVNGGNFTGGTTAVSMQNKATVYITGGSFTGALSDMIIYETFKGSNTYDKSLFNSIKDESREGNGIAETEFKKIDVDYTPGMHITDKDTLYSVIMSATDKLTKNISFTTTEQMCKILDFYQDKWIYGRCENTDKNIIIDESVETIQVTLSLSYKIEYEVAAVLTGIAPESAASSSSIKYANKINGILGRIIKDGMTRKQKVKAVNNYMVKNYSYDYGMSPVSFEFYGALDNGKAVCQGYATLFKLFMDAEGIPCECITGMATSGPNSSDFESHMWNCIKTNGKWYYVDVTFNDGMGSNKFLLLTKKAFYGKGYHY